MDSAGGGDRGDRCTRGFGCVLVVGDIEQVEESEYDAGQSQSSGGLQVSGIGETLFDALLGP